MKKIILLKLLIGSFCALFGQKPIDHSPLKGATIAYYVWEEDEDGCINESTFYLPYAQNYFVAPKRTFPSFKSGNVLINTIRIVLNEPNKKMVIKSKTLFDTLNKKSQRIIWKKEQATSIGSYLWKYQNGTWKIQKEKPVLYFEVDENGKMHFQKSDSVIQLENATPIPTSSHFFIYSYLDSNKKITHQRIFQHNGTEVTESFKLSKQRSPQRYLVFINGYRGPHREKDPTDNVLLRTDTTKYWYKLDKEMDSILKRDARFYFDASMSVKTSCHKNNLGFGWSLLRARLATNRTRKADNYRYLNTEINQEGFEIRKQAGRLAAISYLAMTQQTATNLFIRDTIDIVSHSMGYAYSLGLLEALEGKVVLGKYYAIAPESGCYEGYDWNKFEAIYQYGSNLDQVNPDPVWLQDGVAPQCEVKGLNQLSAPKSGRFFLPPEGIKKNFIDSHMTYSYHWIIPLINNPSQTTPSK